MTATIASRQVLNPGLSLHRIKSNTLSFRVSIHKFQMRVMGLQLILALMLGHGKQQIQGRLVILGFAERSGKMILTLKPKDCEGSNSFVNAEVWIV